MWGWSPAPTSPSRPASSHRRCSRFSHHLTGPRLVLAALRRPRLRCLVPLDHRRHPGQASLVRGRAHRRPLHHLPDLGLDAEGRRHVAGLRAALPRPPVQRRLPQAERKVPRRQPADRHRRHQTARRHQERQDARRDRGVLRLHARRRGRQRLADHHRRGQAPRATLPRRRSQVGPDPRQPEGDRPAVLRLHQLGVGRRPRPLHGSVRPLRNRPDPLPRLLARHHRQLDRVREAVQRRQAGRRGVQVRRRPLRHPGRGQRGGRELVLDESRADLLHGLRLPLPDLRLVRRRRPADDSCRPVAARAGGDDGLAAAST